MEVRRYPEVSENVDEVYEDVRKHGYNSLLTRRHSTTARSRHRMRQEQRLVTDVLQ